MASTRVRRPFSRCVARLSVSLCTTATVPSEVVLMKSCGMMIALRAERVRAEVKERGFWVLSGIGGTLWRDLSTPVVDVWWKTRRGASRIDRTSSVIMRGARRAGDQQRLPRTMLVRSMGGVALPH